MLCVNSAQSLLVWRQLSSRPVPLMLSPGWPSSSAAFVKPLLVNGAVLKFTDGRAGDRAVLSSRAKAPRAVICPPIACARGRLPPASAALNCPSSALRIPVATGGVKHVGETPGATRLDAPAAAAKLAATRQFVKRL